MSLPTSNYEFIETSKKRPQTQMFPYSHSLQRSSSTQSEYNDGHSLTYSASSSQAGESTDSSEVADIEFINDVLMREQYNHELESIQAKGVRIYRQMSRGSVKDVQSGGQPSASTQDHNHTPHKRLSKISYDSPTMVSTDISCDHTPTTVVNTPASTVTGGTNTSSSSIHKRITSQKKQQEETWYSKSWMCGFYRCI